MTIGERIRKYRKEKGWKQSQLAEKADLFTCYISYYETDRWFPSLISIIAIADALGVSIDDLVGRKVKNEEN